MKTYSEIVAAIRDGQPVTDDEMKYALTAGHYYLMRFYFDTAYLLSSTDNNDNDKNLKRVKTRMQNHYDNVTDLQERDLEKFLKGSSMEPGIPIEERTRRMTESTSRVAVNLHNALKNVQK